MLIIFDDMGFYIYFTRVVVCHEMLCIPVATHGHGQPTKLGETTVKKKKDIGRK